MKKPFWGNPVRFLLFLLPALLLSCANEPERESLYSDYYNLARHLHEAGEYARAEYYYLACLRGEPESGDCLFNISLLYLETNRPDRALPYLEKLHRRDRENLLVMDNLGVAYSLMGEWDEALEWYGRVLDIFPWDRTALFNGALVHGERGEGEESLALLEKLRERDKSYATAMALWERIPDWTDGEKLALLEDVQTEEEEEILDLSRKKLELYLAGEKDGEALALLESLIGSNPEEKGDYLFTRGELLLKMYRSEEGLSSLRDAFRLGYRDEARLKALEDRLSPSLGEVLKRLESLYFPAE